MKASKARYSKQKYGLMYNLNSLAFTNLTTSTNLIMNTSWHYTNLINICSTFNMGKRQDKPRLSSRLVNKTRLFWTTLFFVESKFIFTMRDLYFNISCCLGLNMLIQCVFMFLNNFWPLVMSLVGSIVGNVSTSLENLRHFLGLWAKNMYNACNIVSMHNIGDNFDKTIVIGLVLCLMQCKLMK